MDTEYTETRRANPDLISDESSVFQSRDWDEEDRRQIMLYELRGMWDVLSKGEAEVAVLLIAGHSAHHISKLLGVSYRNIRVKIQRIKKKLRKYLINK